MRVEGLGKVYRIGGKRVKYKTLRDTLTDAAMTPFRRLRSAIRGHSSNISTQDIWALRDLSFELKRGEVVGIVGRNGAGKSTLLKILSRITEPTAGFAEIHGRVGSLLEVGTGFHSELTGRENLYLNGAILGMRKDEIERKFDEIVGFAEVDTFIDTPVKHYSSGMYLRLAFAVAAYLETEILLVDEVLAVGDASFQRKCLGKMGDVARQERTVVFVSHNMGAIAQLCGRVLWLDGGQLKLTGFPAEVVASYLSPQAVSRSIWTNPCNSSCSQEAQVKSVCVLSMDNRPTSVVEFDKQFKVEIAYDVFHTIRNLCVLCRLADMQGNIIWTSWDSDTTDWNARVKQPGRYLSICKIPKCLLKPGTYLLSTEVGVFNGKGFGYYENVLAFDVSEVGYHLNANRLGAITPLLEWEVKRIGAPLEPLPPY